MSQLTRRFAPHSLVLVASAIACAACASAPTAGARASRAIFSSEASRPDSVVVRVVNHVDRPVRIYRMRDGARAALGDVAAGAEGRFPLRAADAAGKHLTLAAAPMGGHAAVESKAFRVEGGQVAVFVITPELGGSRVFVDWPTR